MEEKISKILVSEEEIRQRIKELGKIIEKDYEGKELVVIGVLKGAIIFFSDLVRSVNKKMEIDFLTVKSYFGGTRSTGNVKIYRDVQVDITNKHVIVVDDIYDTGYTLNFVKQLLEYRDPLSVKNMCSFTQKKSS